MAIVSAAISACSDQPTNPLEHNSNSPRANSTASATSYLFDTPSDQLAETIPGFAGAYVDAGTLNVLLTAGAYSNNASESAARSSVSQLLSSIGREQMPVRFLPAKFSFLQLRAWESVLRESYVKLGVTRAGIDEINNRLELVLTSQTKIQTLAAQVIASAIPTEAIATRLGSPGSSYTTLLDKVRPARGGSVHSYIF